MKTIPLSEPHLSPDPTPLPEALVTELMADDMLPEYDIDYSKASPNRFASRLAETRTIALDSDVAAVFTSQETVNAVLRALIQTMPQAQFREGVTSEIRTSKTIVSSTASAAPSRGLP